VDKIVKEPEGIPFLKLPPPDRLWTDAFNKKYQDNGNFKYKPATYIQVANGCWWGKCTFCVEQNNRYEVRPVDEVVEELKECKRLGFREVFDDSGTFPTGMWLEKFLERLGGTNGNITIGCNCRCYDYPFDHMARSGFRMVLFGIESANQHTLDRINKGVQIEEAVKVIKKAAKAGLEPHLTVMFGYPWESDEDSIRTLRLLHELLKKGYAKTAQASFYDPPEKNGNKSQKKYIRQIYRVAYSPEFWFNKLRDIHNTDDLKYLWRQIKDGLRLFTNQDNPTREKRWI